MRTCIKKSMSAYFNSWWLSFAVCLLSVLSLLLAVFPLILATEVSLRSLILSFLLLLLVGVSFIAHVCSALWSLFRRRWLKLLSDSVLISLSLCSMYVVISILLGRAMNVGEENFSYRDNIGAMIVVMRVVTLSG